MEASGSLVCAFMIKAIQAAGHKAVASDVDDACAGKYLADDFVQVPKCSDAALWKKMALILEEQQIDVVIPSLDETLVGWSQLEYSKKKGSDTKILISPPETIEIFSDKWKTFQFFEANMIPTPRTSLEQKYPLIKPRNGRGGKGVIISNNMVNMTGCISQEVIVGQEYTVDILCDNQSNPIYIVPRKRIGVKDGKSTKGIVVDHERMNELVRRICRAAKFRGPINLQCFTDARGDIYAIELNPRIAGGMALGFAATENWVPLMIAMLSGHDQFARLPVKYGMQMLRYYAEIFAE